MTPQVCIFGEVLFDHFPGGERVLGGAPFNVAWHLQALGDAPLMLSRVGTDANGEVILEAMQQWRMNSTGIQRDPQHPTGTVQVELHNQEPSYQIVADCAYDFISTDQLPALQGEDLLLYHGSLGLRHPVSRNSLDQVIARTNPAIFLDVNLRPPWWQRDSIDHWLERSRWVKLNRDELAELGFNEGELEDEIIRFQEKYLLEQVILTLGADGALVREADGSLHRRKPECRTQVVDTVGAGDAFSAIYLHGLRANWPVPAILEAAHDFAGKVVQIRGATTTDRSFYQEFLSSLPDPKRG